MTGINTSPWPPPYGQVPVSTEPPLAMQRHRRRRTTVHGRRAMSHWTEDEQLALLVLRDSGASSGEIARALGRTPSAVRQRLGVLGAHISRKS